MSTANPVPETWDLTGDDARRLLRSSGRRRILRDAFKRLRITVRPSAVTICVPAVEP